MSFALSPLVIAFFSAVALLLLLEHRRANLGGRWTVAFVVSMIGYGIVRSWAVRALSESRLGGMPYRLASRHATIFGAPLQEIGGWIAAVALASYCADRLLRRARQSTDAFRTALVAAVLLATVCLAVETAAVLGGWWTWSLSHSESGLLRFPWIALVDWGFVAFDFVLPFELWRRKAPLMVRLGSLLVFPLHLLGHAFAAPWPASLPFSGFDLVHIGIPAGVAACAWCAPVDGGWPARSAEKLRALPVLAVACIVGTTSAQLWLAGEAREIWTILPLSAVAVAVYRFRDEPPRMITERSPRGGAILFCALMAAGLLLRLPPALRAQRFESALTSGIAALSAGQAAQADASFEHALRLRPGHPAALWLLGWSELRQGRRDRARLHLEESLAAEPTSVETVRLLAVLDLQDGRPLEAAAALVQPRRMHPELRDLAYLEWRATRNPGRDDRIPPALLDGASVEQLAAMAALATSLQDERTRAACRERMTAPAPVR